MIAAAGEHGVLQAVQQQSAVGQPRQHVIERQPLNLLFDPFVFGHVTANTPITLKHPLGIENRGSADTDPHQGTVLAPTLEFKIMKRFVRLQPRPMDRPLCLAYPLGIEVPTGVSDITFC